VSVCSNPSAKLRAAQEHIDNGHAAALIGQMHSRPLSLSASKHHVCVLNLIVRKLLLDVAIESNQIEYNCHGLAAIVRGTHCKYVDYVLQDKGRTPHRINVHLVCGTRRIHSETVYTGTSCRARGVAAPL
jgi:hypothetical protein